MGVQRVRRGGKGVSLRGILREGLGGEDLHEEAV